MAYLELPRYPNGQVVLPGRITKRITADFMWDTTLPSWLTTTAGTASFTDLSNSGGRVAVVTDATTGAAATITTTNAIDLSRVQSLLWEVEGFVTTDVGTGIDLNIGLRDTANTFGAYFTQSGASTNGVRAKYAGDTTTGQASNANVINLGEGNRNKNFSILLLPALKHAYYLEGDQVGADWDMTANLPLGAVKPSIGITTKSATAKTMRIHRLALTVTLN